jgi:ABC-2 type transport system ATP-binding protein
VVRSLAELGKTVFLTTHYMDEAQYLAAIAAVIAKGRIVAEGPPDRLGGRDVAATTVQFVAPSGVELPDWVRAGAAPDGGPVRLSSADPVRTLHDLTGWALERGIALDGLQVNRPSLEDVYLELTGGEAGSELG